MCCAIVHKEAIMFLFEKQNPKKQVPGQEVVPVGISVLKKQVSWLWNQDLLGSRIFFCGGDQKSARVEVWSVHQVKTRMIRDGF